MATLIAKTQKCMRGILDVNCRQCLVILATIHGHLSSPYLPHPFFTPPASAFLPCILIWMGSSQWIRSIKGSRKRKMHVIFNLAPCMLFMIHELHQACMTLSAIFFGALSVLVPLEGVDRQMATESSMEGLHVHFYSMEAMACLVHSICHKIEILWEW